MANVNLRVGQYVPPPDMDLAERVLRAETYLAQLSQEIEVLQASAQMQLKALAERLAELEKAPSSASV